MGCAVCIAESACPSSSARYTCRVQRTMSMKQPDAMKPKTAAAAPKRARRSPAMTAQQPNAGRPLQPEPIIHSGDEQIRIRAYQFYLERGGAPGDPVSDWLRAERELIGERAIES